MVIPYRCGKGPGLVPWAAIKRPKAGQSRPRSQGSTLHSLFLLSRAGYLSSFMALYHRQTVLSSNGERDFGLDERASCAHLSGVNLYCGNGSTRTVTLNLFGEVVRRFFEF
ncbi:hypothetical protein HNY73_021725 [Argiope bruennichi]|uniref:Uncharacterized protein n=1 Tax=Argiope bruennichi TaxID=94029 RepID=A0A8T0DYF1_ARGBR|nr:hypothetical protein HNY73_021725 [Argiope bruennichi]